MALNRVIDTIVETLDPLDMDAPRLDVVAELSLRNIHLPHGRGTAFNDTALQQALRWLSRPPSSSSMLSSSSAMAATLSAGHLTRTKEIRHPDYSVLVSSAPLRKFRHLRINSTHAASASSTQASSATKRTRTQLLLDEYQAYVLILALVVEIKWEKYFKALCQTIAYLVTSNEMCGTPMAVVLCSRRFSRLFALGNGHVALETGRTSDWGKTTDLWSMYVAPGNKADFLAHSLTAIDATNVDTFQIFVETIRVTLLAVSAIPVGHDFATSGFAQAVEDIFAAELGHPCRNIPATVSNPLPVLGLPMRTYASNLGLASARTSRMDFSRPPSIVPAVPATAYHDPATDSTRQIWTAIGGARHDDAAVRRRIRDQYPDIFPTGVDAVDAETRNADHDRGGDGDDGEEDGGTDGSKKPGQRGGTGCGKDGAGEGSSGQQQPERDDEPSGPQDEHGAEQDADDQSETRVSSLTRHALVHLSKQNQWDAMARLLGLDPLTLQRATGAGQCELGPGYPDNDNDHANDAEDDGYNSSDSDGTDDDSDADLSAIAGLDPVMIALLLCNVRVSLISPEQADRMVHRMGKTALRFPAAGPNATSAAASDSASARTPAPARTPMPMAAKKSLFGPDHDHDHDHDHDYDYCSAWTASVAQ